MITTAEVNLAAEQTAFRPEIVEKVLRLQNILQRLGRHESTAGRWVLKGGTALNLLHLDVPRLSVDIDVNSIGADDVQGMRAARPGFEQALMSCCEREGCRVKRAPSEHAGGKFRLRYASVVGREQNLEVDVSYMARVPLWGEHRLRFRFPPDSEVDVPTLALEELAAGKFTALLQRTAARDAFDAACLLELAPDLLSRKTFRTAFVCFMAAARTDSRRLVPRPYPLAAASIEQQLMPLMRRGPQVAARSRDELAAWIHRSVDPAVERLLDWSPGEVQFLDALLDQGEVDAAALHDDLAVQDRIRKQPMLNWKARHVREHRGDT